MQLSEYKQRIADQFDALAPNRRNWKRKNKYYYDLQTAYLRFLVPPGQRVLELGCGTGETLAALEPSHGVGVDVSEMMVAEAAREHPGLTFIHGDAEDSATWGLRPGTREGTWVVWWKR